MDPFGLPAIHASSENQLDLVSQFSMERLKPHLHLIYTRKYSKGGGTEPLADATMMVVTFLPVPSIDCVHTIFHAMAW